MVALLTWALLPQSADAQALVVTTCGTLPLVYKAGATRQNTVDVNGNQCVSGNITATATTTATAASSLPTISAGTGAALYESLGAGLYVQPVFGSASGGGTQVDATHGLPVNVLTSVLPTGAATSALQTTGNTSLSSLVTNLGTLPYDGSGYLEVNVKAGGAGGGAVYGPTAAGSPAANPPVLMGGTVDGTATGNVDNWKVSGGIGFVSSVLTAGSAIVGKFGIDQTTPGTTNAVQANVASGGIASGAIASGAFASGSVASGAFASGSLAAGSMVDLLTMRGSAGGGTAAADSILAGGVYNSSAPTLTNGQQASLQFTSAGSLHATVDNTNANGQATMANSSPVVIASNQSALPVSPQAVASGGALNYGPLYSAASNNATNVKSSPGTIYTITVTQSTTTALELKLYNTSSSPTCSSATGIVDNIPIPSNATSPGYHLTYPVGRAFSTGISFCLVAFGNPASSTDNSNAVTGATVSMTYD